MIWGKKGIMVLLEKNSWEYKKDIAWLNKKWLEIPGKKYEAKEMQTYAQFALA